MRIAAFVISLLLLAGTVEPTRGWLIALTVVAGLAMVRPRFGRFVGLRAALDLRLAVFVFAVLLLAGTVDPTRDWLIGLSILSGFAMVMPGALSLDAFGERSRRHWHRGSRWEWRSGRGPWDREWEIEFSQPSRPARPARRSWDPFAEEDWP